MTKGREIIDNFTDGILNIDPGMLKTAGVLAAKAQMEMHDLHSRVIACHCECLGMNAEDTIAACEGSKIPYNDKDYNETMQKWGLVDEDNNTLI